MHHSHQPIISPSLMVRLCLGSYLVLRRTAEEDIFWDGSRGQGRGGTGCWDRGTNLSAWFAVWSWNTNSSTMNYARNIIRNCENSCSCVAFNEVPYQTHCCCHFLWIRQNKLRVVWYSGYLITSYLLFICEDCDKAIIEIWFWIASMTAYPK